MGLLSLCKCACVCVLVRAGVVVRVCVCVCKNHSISKVLERRGMALIHAAMSNKHMGWLRLVGSLKLQVSFAEYSLFYRAVLHKRPVILRSLLIVATP